MRNYTSPRVDADAFNCPHCGAFAHQLWYAVYGENNKGAKAPISDFRISECQYCKKFAVWHVVFRQGYYQPIGRMIHPNTAHTPLPNEDMPDDVKPDFLEAREIVNSSPRGAAALLRLCIQKLLIHLGEKGKDINADIGKLVAKGLPVTIQQALDSVRVIGNEAVHPGELDLRDDTVTAIALFDLVNLIVDNRISEPNRIKAVYDKLPQTKKDGIDQRDKRP